MIAYNYLQILITHLLCNKHFGQIADYCSSNSLSNQAYNIGRTVFIGEGSGQVIWNFDPQSLMIQKLDIETIFLKDTFKLVYTAFAFNFARCDRSNSSNYCANTGKARTLAIAVGQRIKSNEPNGYVTYTFKNGELSLMSGNSELVWDLKNSSTVSGDFWVQNAKWVYSSMVFIPQLKQLLASVYKTTDSSKTHQLMSKTLKPNGEWNAWTNIGKIEFFGMFHIDGRTFGMNRNNIIHEIIIINNKYEFKKISSVKEFLNCYENSTLVIKDRITFTRDDTQTTHANELPSNDVMPGVEQTHSSTETTDSEKKDSDSVLIIVIIIIVVIIVISCCICLGLYFFVFRKMRKQTNVEYQTSSKFKHHESKSESKRSKSPKKKRSQTVRPSTSTTKTDMFSKPFTKSDNDINIATNDSSTKQSAAKSAKSDKSLDKKVSSKPKSVKIDNKSLDKNVSSKPKSVKIDNKSMGENVSSKPKSAKSDKPLDKNVSSKRKPQEKSAAVSKYKTVRSSISI